VTRDPEDAAGGRDFIPRLPDGLLARPRLYERLSEFTPITVVRGFQGTGKTTLVGSWLNEIPTSDALNVWIDMSRDLAKSRTKLGIYAWKQARAIGLGWDGVAEPEGAEFHAAVAQYAAGPRGVMVFDYAGRLDDRHDVLTDLVGLVQRHERLQLVLISRGPHPMEDIAAGTLDVNVIDSEELMLTVTEIAQLGLAMGVELADAQAEAIHDAVGGWMAPVRLIIQDSIRTGELSLTAARHYFDHTVIPALDRLTVLDRLERLALTDEELDPALAQVILNAGQSEGAQATASPVGESEAAALLTGLQQSGLCTRRHREGDVPIAVLPSLVRSSLREAFSSARPEEAKTIHRRLARWYRDLDHHRQTTEAQATPTPRRMTMFEHAVAGQDWPLVAELYEEFGAALSLRYGQRMRAALASSPQEVLTAYPRLRAALAAAHVRAAQEAGDNWIGAAREYFRTCSEIIANAQADLSAPDLLEIGAGHLIGLRAKGRLSEAIAFGSDIETRIAGIDPSPRVSPDRMSWFLNHLGTAHLLSGNSIDASQRYQQIWSYRAEAEADYIVRNAAMNLAMIHALQGNFDRTQEWLERGQLYDGDQTPVGSVSKTAEQVAASLLTLDRLDCDAAHDQLWLESEEQSAQEFWPFVTYVRAQHGLHFATAVSALTRLDVAAATHASPATEEGVAALLMTRARADLLLAAGEGQRARTLVNSFTAVNRVLASAAASMLAVPRARIYLLSGNLRAALRLATSTSARRDAPARARLEMELIAAVAAMRMNDSGGAAEHMRNVMDLYSKTRSLRVFATISPTDRDDLLRVVDASLSDADNDLLAKQQPIYPESIELIRLTKREQELLHAMLTHETRHDIAAALFVSPNTVKFHQASLYRKLDTTNRADTLIRARELNLLSDSDEESDATAAP
jgi:LuxR family maltose regulon positive regulatory protein